MEISKEKDINLHRSESEKYLFNFLPYFFNSKYPLFLTNSTPPHRTFYKTT